MGENLEQDSVGRSPVEDVRLRDSPADRVQRGLSLGDHAGADGSFFDQCSQL
jgi:hypothetical protein